MMDSENSGISSGDGGLLNNVNVKEEDSVQMSSCSRPMEGLHSAWPAPFLTKTYDMVENPLTDTVLSWSSNNNSFIVWNCHQLSTDLLPKYFKHNNFSSFVRQLNTYGFRKVDLDRWEFAHEGFLRGQKHLLKLIQRRKPSHPSQFLDLQHHHHQQGVGACVEVQQFGMVGEIEGLKREKSVLMMEVVKLKQKQQSTRNQLQNMGLRLQATEQREQHILTFLAKAIKNPTFLEQLSQNKQATKRLATDKKRRRLLKGKAEQERQSPSSSKGGIVKNQANTSIPSDSDNAQNTTNLEAFFSAIPHENISMNPIETASTFNMDSIYLDRAEGEDRDLETVKDVLWEELLQFDSGTQADANFPDEDKGNSSSQSESSLLAEQIGQTAFHQSIPISSENVVAHELQFNLPSQPVQCKPILFLNPVNQSSFG